MVGVRLAGGQVLPAGEVVLSAGAYGTPAVLLRSGVGPAAHLANLGIGLVADLPVGEGLRDHPAYFTTFALKGDVRDMSPAGAAVLATGSAEATDGDLDLWVFAYNRFAPPWGLGGPALLLGAAVMRPASRGSVRLRSADPADRPVIALNLLADPADRRRLLEAVRVARTAPLADLIDHETGPAAEADAALPAAIEANVSIFDHGCCTAPMGADDDPRAVCDRAGRVRRVSGLRVADASVFPDTPSVPINLTTIMAAERIAAEMVSAGGLPDGHAGTATTGGGSASR